MIAVPTADAQKSGFGRHGGSANDDTRNPYQMGYVGGIEVSNRDVRNGRVQKELMLWKIDAGGLWIDNSLRALLERGLEQGDDIGRVGGQLVCELFIVGDQMCQVDIAEILLHQHVLPKLVSVNVGSVDLKCEHKVFQLALEFRARF